MVRDMGSFNFIVTFGTKEDRAEVINHGLSAVEDFMVKMKEWTPRTVCEKRRVWLEIWGLPPQAWSKGNFARITKGIGNLVEIDQDTAEGLSMEAAKIRITGDGNISTKTSCPVCEYHDISGENNQMSVSRVEDTIRDNILMHHSQSNVPDKSNQEDDNLYVSDTKASATTVHNQQEVEEQTRVVMRSGEEEQPCNINCEEGINNGGPNLSFFLGTTEFSKKEPDNNDTLNNEDVSQKTAEGGIDYNLEQEFEIISKCGQMGEENRVHLMEMEHRGTQESSPLSRPPGFTYHGPQASKAQQTSTKRKRGRPKKTKQTKIKQTTNILQEEDSFDDFNTEDEIEARRTWEIGKELDLVAEDNEDTIGTITKLRRSARHAKKVAGPAS
ncbi:hypothetical protein RIF29_27361 [Crotalaria pallida]|uniref:DUF4283 domain-containing protein n=1 Tax=Crotalaria pallida TaxID=3830 RepID=A0AAN9EPV5_CROPI